LHAQQTKQNCSCNEIYFYFLRGDNYLSARPPRGHQQNKHSFIARTANIKDNNVNWNELLLENKTKKNFQVYAKDRNISTEKELLIVLVFPLKAFHNSIMEI